ncbi:MAG: TetR/AcrR family transcriptional regulator [Candidatus Binataceae bacterium]
MNGPGGTGVVSHRAERLLGEAEALFLAEGFLHLSMDDLAKRLRCSKRTLYEIAASREEFIELVIERSIERNAREFEEAAKRARNWNGALEAYLDCVAESVRSASTQLVRDMNGFAPTARLLARARADRVEGLKRIVDSGIRDGQFGHVDSKLVAEVFLAGLTRISDADFLATTRLSWTQALKIFFRLIVTGLVPRNGATAPANRHTKTSSSNAAKREAERARRMRRASIPRAIVPA